jgi:hypothetical protein|tara:strand:- start:6097 stop:6279 length:183 start_codon:yes stop_codon:yes gene_type:complete
MGRNSDLHIGMQEDGVDLEDEAAIAKWIAEYMTSDEYLREHITQAKKVLKDVTIESESML